MHTRCDETLVVFVPDLYEIQRCSVWRPEGLTSQREDIIRLPNVMEVDTIRRCAPLSANGLSFYLVTNKMGRTEMLVRGNTCSVFV